MSRFVGYCYDSGGWGGDLSGQLIKEEPDGWVGVAGHISSDQMWAERDIGYHFEEREDPDPADTFEWIGFITTNKELEAYPPAHPLEEGAKA